MFYKDFKGYKNKEKSDSNKWKPSRIERNIDTNDENDANADNTAYADDDANADIIK